MDPPPPPYFPPRYVPYNNQFEFNTPPRVRVSNGFNQFNTNNNNNNNNNHQLGFRDSFIGPRLGFQENYSNSHVNGYGSNLGNIRNLGSYGNGPSSLGNYGIGPSSLGNYGIGPSSLGNYDNRPKIYHDIPKNLGNFDNGPKSWGNYANGPKSLGNYDNGPKSLKSYDFGPKSLADYEPKSLGNYDNGPKSLKSYDFGPRSLADYESKSLGNYDNGPKNLKSYDFGPRSLADYESKSLGNYDNGPKNLKSYDFGPSSLADHEPKSLGNYENGPKSLGSYDNGPKSLGNYDNGQLYRGSVENGTRSGNFVNGDVGIYGSGSNLNNFSNFGKFGNRGGKKEGYNNSPKKKKSALLRVQYNETKNVRNKRSPVELDVSFKSNSLVAKAIEVEQVKRRSKNSKRKAKKMSKVVWPMCRVSVPEKDESFEAKIGSLKSVVTNSKSKDEDLGSMDEDVFVDIGGTPVRNVKGKVNGNSFTNLSIPISGKGISVHGCTTSGYISDGSLSCEKDFVDVVSNGDNNGICLEETDGHANLSSDGHFDKNQVDITVFKNDEVYKNTDKDIVVIENFSTGDMASARVDNHVDFSEGCTSVSREEGEIEENLVTPLDNNSPTGYIAKEQHIEVSSIEKEKVFELGSSSRVNSEDDYESLSEGTSTSGEQLFANRDEQWTQLDNIDVSSKLDTLSSARSSPCSKSAIILLGSDGKSLREEDLTEDYPHGEQETGKQDNGKEFDVDEEQGMQIIESVEDKIDLDNGIDTYQIPVSDMECDHHLLENDSVPSLPTDPSVSKDSKAVACLTKFCDKKVESVSESDRVFTESQISDTGIGLDQISEGMDLDIPSNQDKNPSANGPSVVYSLPTLQSTGTSKNSGHEKGNVSPLNSKFVKSVGINTIKNLLPPAVPRVFRPNPSVTKTAPTSNNLKPRTWQRSSSPSIPPVPVKQSYTSSVYIRPQSATVTRNVTSTAYVRQGNSLVRQPSPIRDTPKVTHALGSSRSWINPATLDETKKLTGNDNKVNFSPLRSSLRTEQNAVFERPNTPPLSCSTKISSYPNLSSGSGISTLSVDPPQNVCPQRELDPLKLEENVDLIKPSSSIAEFSASHESPARQVDSPESRGTVDSIFVPTSTKKVVYVKRKANQLLAASSSGLSPPNTGNTEASSSGGYFKRRKHQLVRNSLDTGLKVGMPDENLKSQAKSALQIASSFQRRSGKGFGKTCKPSRLSRVWTLHDTQPLKKETSLLSQVWPRLFPWKRANQRRRFTYTSASAPTNGSLTSIRNLLLSRQRKTIYKRSRRGLSLTIAKVLSVDGSSLKWSKSIEKNCKKANEEATLAVAAVEKKKRDVTARTKSKNHISRKLVHTIELHPGERIFRVGAARYKMDPTRRSLQRIPDEESSCSVAFQSGKGVKKACVPRRLVIGNQEYVRIGNGNQLIRDPKKRIRVLASEKVRWSLHTARISLAKKKTYCQFFTRFGKCNKGGGKCPYIHDPEKITVCTKFLKGTCSDSDCKLTHKVIPERMEDCSYFLQGLCSNEACPYRHVNVNPNASVCEGFLKGYCADGNECRKKHSYVCPVFESTGACSRGSKCKLHHPNRNKGRKRKPLRGKNNVRGRYFGSEHIGAFDTKGAVSNKQSTEDDDDMFFQEGADFIPLDVSDEEDVEPFDSSFEQKSSNDSHLVDVDSDDLIMPV